MSVARRQTIAMVLLVALPLCVTGLIGHGLWRLDLALRNVTEEYAEARMLQPIDRNLHAAAVVLGSGDPLLQSGARGYLEEAQAAMEHYLATQYDSVETVQHQAVESDQASLLLGRLRELLSEEGRRESASSQLARAQELHRGLGVLQREADKGVLRAQESADQTRRGTLWRVVIASVGSTVICALLLVWSTRSVNRRLREVHRRLTERSPGGPARTARGLGEVVSQIEDLNSQMLEKIEESGRELLRRERLVGIGLLAADVAHEINNPMNAMLGLSELGLRTVERGPVDETSRMELQESLAVMRREALRCKGIVERLVAMVRRDQAPSRFDAAQLLQETVRVAQAARPDRAGCFSVDGSSQVHVIAPANEVRQIVLTLLINAADAVAPDGRIEADVTRADGEVRLRVRDNGRGFTESMRRTFFTPFKSYKEDGQGAGLGLSIAQALAEGMGATLTPYSEGPGRGSTFVLTIPVPEGDR